MTTTENPNLLVDEPFRDELFSCARLEKYAIFLASNLKCKIEHSRGKSLLSRLAENHKKLLANYQRLIEALEHNQEIPPSGEWIVDNFHIVDDQVREIKQDLPETFYRTLPKLNDGELKGLPRVYAMALSLLAHTDSNLERETMKRYLDAFQTVSPLHIGELWAFPIHLRLALVENLRRISVKNLKTQSFKKAANEIVESLLTEVDATDAFISQQQEKLARLFGSSRSNGCALISLIERKLRDQDPRFQTILDNLKAASQYSTLSLEDIIHRDHQDQSSDQATTRNIICSMRLLSTLDWRVFFEDVCLVDKILARDPTGDYLRMDFSSRNSYRNVIERVAVRTSVDELEIAKVAIELSQRSQGRENHVGYYLVDQGVEQLETLFKYRLTWREKCKRGILCHATIFYVLSMIALIALTLLPVIYFGISQKAGIWILLASCTVAFFSASNVALNFLSLFVSFLFGPRILPRLSLSEGIPNNAKTLVALPIIFNSKNQIANCLEGLEIRFLANQDKNLLFAILSDYPDSDEETLSGDRDILQTLKTGIEELNIRYCPDRPRLFLFHRHRKWNPIEKKWMGWERKRGKLHELNRFLMGKQNLSFCEAPTLSEELRGVKYVITIDADTQLPRDSAKKLIATMHHTLNRPVYDEQKRCVVQGYTILQPRISISLESANHCLFSRIFSGHTGFDPYTCAVSDIYQDLFGAGIYTGKGLYDVEVFEKILAGRFPENTILSHDLLEGEYCRAALISNIEFLDDFPSSYTAYSARQHRWTRGDWQIFQWLFLKVPNAENLSIANPLSIISKWKILDNLRRSLVAPFTFAWFLLAWTILPGQTWIWTLIILGLIMAPSYAHATTNLILHPKGIPWSSNFWNVWGNFWNNTAQVTIILCSLAHQSYVQVDAIVRSCFRKLYSNRYLLEWTTAASTNQRQSQTSFLGISTITISSILAVFSFLLLILVSRIPLSSLPFLLVWLLFPSLAETMSKSWTPKFDQLNEKEKAFYLQIAIATWRYFIKFVDEKTNWLPPDNVQFDPKTVIAERTSPTNMGLLLLSTAAANELGLITFNTCLEKIEKTLITMLTLDRHKGHFYNWYDTATLKPLEPKYVSTVDSGNLAGHLITVKQMLIKMPSRPLISESHWNVIKQNFSDLKEQINLVSSANATIQKVQKEWNHLGRTLNVAYPSSSRDWLILLNSLEKASKKILTTLPEIKENAEALALQDSVNFFCKHLQDLQNCICILFPWLSKKGPESYFDKNLETILATSLSPDHLINQIELYLKKRSSPQQKNISEQLIEDLKDSHKILSSLKFKCHELADICGKVSSQTDFEFLYDEDRKIFCIGFNCSESQCDNSYYDLLASEARLTSFLAIARGQIAQEHWFQLGRQITEIKGKRALISWSASMFEYLMPLLIMKQYRDTLLFESHQSVIDIQMEYARGHGVPWGVSESGYHARDLQQNYQYGPFGIPGLGIKRGLREELVVAPYATALAASLQPRKALRNLARMKKMGWYGTYGFFEAVDFTPSRVPPGKSFALVKSHMAHHHGMTICAITNILNDNILQHHFHSDPEIGATEMLLQERIPTRVDIQFPRWEELTSTEKIPQKWKEASRKVFSPNTPNPKVHVLSNGNYTVMVSAAGSGFSQWGEIAVTRWRPDPTTDNYGFLIFLKNKDEIWSPSYWPSANEGIGTYEVSFSEHKAEFSRSQGKIKTHLEIIVSPEDDAELRRLKISNQSDQQLQLEVTSYLEPVALKLEADMAHPAFGKLFFLTEFLKEKNALIGHRRARSNNEKDSWVFHLVAGTAEECSFETDRMRFIGRNRTLLNPLAFAHKNSLSRSVGSTLDPIFSLRAPIKLNPGESTQLVFVLGAAPNRDAALEAIDRLSDIRRFDRENEMAWTRCQIESKHLQLPPEDINLFQDLATTVFYSIPALRPSAGVIAKNSLNQSALWPLGISGDLPIFVVRLQSTQDFLLVREMLRFHEYLRLKKISFDLVILNEMPSGYRMILQDTVANLIKINRGQHLLEKKGGIFSLRSELISPEILGLLQSSAKAVFSFQRGTFKDQVNRLTRTHFISPKPLQITPAKIFHPTPVLKRPELELFNGLGGFASGGKEYVIFLEGLKTTPAPWSNVISNESGFGFLVTESGTGYTWSQNSRENKLTPWSNDPVSDCAGECIYLRDEESGEFWSPTPWPIRGQTPYLIRHGQGYSEFEHNTNGISQKLTLFVPRKDKIKIFLLKIKNHTGRRRELSIFFFIEWVLGVNRSSTSHFIRSSVGAESKILLAQNPFSIEFGKLWAFVSVNQSCTSYTADRTEFLGRHGSHQDPLALRSDRLGHRTAAGLDPCAALQCRISIEQEEEKTLIFCLGQEESMAEAELSAKKYSSLEKTQAALSEVVSFWDSILETVNIRTPERELDLLFNRWLLYQILSCRIWGRTAFYQAGGAFGFRDQLQDSLALVHARPDILATHLQETAKHQFVEGDVLHWWHPPSGRGVRTHFSDDLLWLPYTVCQYIKTTGDNTILDRTAPFCEGPALSLDQEDHYFQPTQTNQEYNVFEHCKRAIDHSLRLGAHGLPLMKGGDWNDGMNRVGYQGRGESIWLGWFLANILVEFAEICQRRNLSDLAKTYLTKARDITESIEEKGWDGSWYLRAFFDDGTPLGSHTNDECQIDSIAQTWAVISKLGDKNRCAKAMSAVHENLINPKNKLILLFKPPFSHSHLDPGYIKSYVPGVRENGGQYTHAAIWTMMAFALLGDRNNVSETLSIIIPSHHSSSPDAVHRYKVEPYVVSADIYGLFPHIGPGGWTWYTGSAAWLYRAILENILGLRREGDHLFISPCPPFQWQDFEISYRFKNTTYQINVKKCQTLNEHNQMIKMDGKRITGKMIPLVNDQKKHIIEITPNIEISAFEEES